jgi:single-stranded-DNA-specific exonuclease
MIWKKEPVAANEVRHLNEHYGVDLLTSSILVRRGRSDANQVKFYLERELTFLHNPFHFDDMEEVVERIGEAASEGERVRIFGDRDVDGITSTALLFTELQSMGIEADWRLPEGDDPYGLTLAGVDEAHSMGVGLIITVDSGISNTDEIAHANSLGIDTIVIDHHIAGSSLPPALAIINPRIAGSGYPFEDLSGVGVVAKVIWALRFSQTPFYQQEFILAHAQPGNDTVIIQALRMQNLLVLDRIIEEINPGLISPSQSKAFEFLSAGVPIYVLDEGTERAQLKQAFGKQVDIYLGELRPQLESVMPIIRGKGLFALSSMSRATKYSRHGRDELDTLASLFIAYVTKATPSLDSGYEQILDLVAIGTIADLMPMEDENRLLVRRGLAVLSRGDRKSLIPLMAQQNLLGKSLSTSDISWQISPVLNAAGRMGRPSVALNFLLAEDPIKAQELASELLGLNRERQSIGEEAWTKILPLAQESFEQTGSKMVIVQEGVVNRGITGVMANRLLRHYGAPAIVFASVEEGGRVTASIRSTESFNSLDFLEHFDELLLDWGGHPCAGGFSLEAELLPTLIRRMMSYIDELDCPEEDDGQLVIDCTVTEEYMTPSLIDIVEFFEPFGEKNPPLIMTMEGAVVEAIQQMGNKSGGAAHLKLTLAYGSYRWPALYWQAADKVGELFDVDSRIDVAFRLNRNYFRSQESLQLIILDLKPHSGA